MSICQARDWLARYATADGAHYLPVVAWRMNEDGYVRGVVSGFYAPEFRSDLVDADELPNFDGYVYGVWTDEMGP